MSNKARGLAALVAVLAMGVVAAQVAQAHEFRNVQPAILTGGSADPEEPDD